MPDESNPIPFANPAIHLPMSDSGVPLPWSHQECRTEDQDLQQQENKTSFNKKTSLTLVIGRKAAGKSRVVEEIKKKFSQEGKNLLGEEGREGKKGKQPRISFLDLDEEIEKLFQIEREAVINTDDEGEEGEEDEDDEEGNGFPICRTVEGNSDSPQKFNICPESGQSYDDHENFEPQTPEDLFESPVDWTFVIALLIARVRREQAERAERPDEVEHCVVSVSDCYLRNFDSLCASLFPRMEEDSLGEKNPEKMPDKLILRDVFLEAADEIFFEENEENEEATANKFQFLFEEEEDESDEDASDESENDSSSAQNKKELEWPHTREKEPRKSLTSFTSSNKNMLKMALQDYLRENFLLENTLYTLKKTDILPIFLARGPKVYQLWKEKLIPCIKESDYVVVNEDNCEDEERFVEAVNQRVRYLTDGEKTSAEEYFDPKEMYEEFFVKMKAGSSRHEEEGSKFFLPNLLTNCFTRSGKKRKTTSIEAVGDDIFANSNYLGSQTASSSSSSGSSLITPLSTPPRHPLSTPPRYSHASQPADLGASSSVKVWQGKQTMASPETGLGKKTEEKRGFSSLFLEEGGKEGGGKEKKEEKEEEEKQEKGKPDLLLQKSSVPYVPYIPWTLSFHATRPFHPARLAQFLEEADIGNFINKGNFTNKGNNLINKGTNSSDNNPSEQNNYELNNHPLNPVVFSHGTIWLPKSNKIKCSWKSFGRTSQVAPTEEEWRCRNDEKFTKIEFWGITGIEDQILQLQKEDLQTAKNDALKQGQESDANCFEGNSSNTDSSSSSSSDSNSSDDAVHKKKNTDAVHKTGNTDPVPKQENNEPPSTSKENTEHRATTEPRAVSLAKCRLEMSLNACLLTDAEMATYPEGWRNLEDKLFGFLAEEEGYPWFE